MAKVGGEIDLAARGAGDGNVRLANAGARFLTAQEVDVHGIAAVADAPGDDVDGDLITMPQRGAKFALEMYIGQG